MHVFLTPCTYRYEMFVHPCWKSHIAKENWSTTTCILHHPLQPLQGACALARLVPTKGGKHIASAELRSPKPMGKQNDVCKIIHWRWSETIQSTTCIYYIYIIYHISYIIYHISYINIECIIYYSLRHYITLQRPLQLSTIQVQVMSAWISSANAYKWMHIVCVRTDLLQARTRQRHGRTMLTLSYLLQSSYRCFSVSKGTAMDSWSRLKSVGDLSITPQSLRCPDPSRIAKSNFFFKISKLLYLAESCCWWVPFWIHPI